MECKLHPAQLRLLESIATTEQYRQKLELNTRVKSDKFRGLDKIPSNRDTKTKSLQLTYLTVLVRLPLEREYK